MLPSIRSATLIWVVTCMDSQTSFGRETSGGVGECQLHSQATRDFAYRLHKVWMAMLQTQQ